MGPRYGAKGWVYLIPYLCGQGLSAAVGPYVLDEINRAEKAGGPELAEKTMIPLLVTDHLNDQMAALNWLKSQKSIPPTRIAGAGQSPSVEFEQFLGCMRIPIAQPLMRSALR